MSYPTEKAAFIQVATERNKLRAERDRLKEINSFLRQDKKELLAACKALEDSLHKVSNGGFATLNEALTLGRLKKLCRAWRDELRAAIAKAEKE